jgi:hypothetical protein
MAKRKTKYTKLSGKTLDQLWAKKVKDLAGNKCEMCDSVENLNAHHIQPKRIYNTRWYLPNGVCLCKVCHTSGRYSAHKNPLSFFGKMCEKRGSAWCKDLVAVTIIKNWKEHLVQIKESLQKNSILLDQDRSGVENSL